MPWGSPLVGGTTLIRTAIQSPNYVAGVSGWIIRKDGSAEFNNLVARGSISAGGGTVLLNAGGLHIEGSGVQFDINITAGFLARSLPDNGKAAQLIAPTLFLTPQTPTPGLGLSLAGGQINAACPNSAGVETPQLNLFGGNISGKAQSAMSLAGQTSASGTDNSSIDLFANNITLNVATSGRTQFHRGETGSTALSFTALASTSFTVTFAKPYIAAPRVFTNIDTAPGSTARWCSRAINITTTQFTYFVFAADNVANTWVNVPLSWGAYTLT